MKKKGLELSINFLVIVIISIVVLSTGLLIIRNYFSTATEIKQQLDEQTQAKIEELVSDGSTVVVPFKRKEIAAGTAGIFGLGILNVDRNNNLFTVDIISTKFIDPAGNSFDDPGKENWLLYEKEHNIPYKETKKIPARVSVPEGTEKGSYIFNIEVNGGIYGLTKITVVVP